MPTTVTLEGKLKRNLEAYKKKYASRIENGVRAAAGILLDTAKDLAPKETHAMVDSGHVIREGGGWNSDFVVGFGSLEFDASSYGPDRVRRPPFFYTVHVHNANPFLEAAVIVSKDRMAHAINTELLR